MAGLQQVWQPGQDPTLYDPNFQGPNGTNMTVYESYIVPLKGNVDIPNPWYQQQLTEYNKQVKLAKQTLGQVDANGVPINIMTGSAAGSGGGMFPALQNQVNPTTGMTPAQANQFLSSINASINGPRQNVYTKDSGDWSSFIGNMMAAGVVGTMGAGALGLFGPAAGAGAGAGVAGSGAGNIGMFSPTGVGGFGVGGAATGSSIGSSLGSLINNPLSSLGNAIKSVIGGGSSLSQEQLAQLAAQDEATGLIQANSLNESLAGIGGLAGLAGQSASGLSNLFSGSNLLSLGANLAGGLISANAANNAADTQSAAANNAAQLEAASAQKALDLQKYMYDTSRSDLTPWRTTGTAALQRLSDMTGLPNANGTVNPYTFNSSDPSYAFRLSEGNRAIDAGLRARGMFNSGGALKELTNYNSNLASTEFGNEFNRVGTLAGYGQNATNFGNTLGANYATNSSNTLTNSAANSANALMAGANARASGYIGNSNAWGTALGNISNTLSGNPYANLLSKLYGL